MKKLELSDSKISLIHQTCNVYGRFSYKEKEKQVTEMKLNVSIG